MLGPYGFGRAVFNAVAAFCALFALALGVAAAATAPPTIVVLGDSLTAGLGLDPEQAFPARLQAYLTERGVAVKIDNAGVSGDTSAGGRSRLDWALAGKPDAVMVELGANDALRGIDPKVTEANLDAILAELTRRKIKVLLCGMLAPPNLGRDYGAAFNGIYPKLAAKYHVTLYPFFLDGVAAEPALNQADGMHPNRQGVAVIVQRIAPQVEALLKN